MDDVTNPAQGDLMVRVLECGRLFHLWVIGITPLNSVKLDTGAISSNK